MNNIEPIKRRDPPELIGNGKKQKTSRIGWSHITAFKVLLANMDRFVTVDELSRVFYHKVTDDGRRKVRKNLSPFLKYVLFQHSYSLIVEPQNARGRAGAIKIYNPSSEYETSLLKNKGDKMLKTGELKLDEFDKYMMALTFKPKIEDQAG